MIIKKLSYTFDTNIPFLELPIQKMTGTFFETTTDSSQGDLTTSEVKVYLPEEREDQYKSLVKNLVRAGAIFKVTVSDNTVYTIGQDELRSKLLYKRTFADKPGGKYGYEITITWKSLSGAKT